MGYRIYRGAHNNLPDESSFVSAKEIFDICSKACAEDLVIALVSGGGSALLSLPADGITIEEKRQVGTRITLMDTIHIP